MLAAELVETSRLFARCAAKIEPEWIEEVAGDRVTRDYFEPHWDEKRGEVVASERVQLYGLTLVRAAAACRSARIDPAAARDVFIREALVPGALATRGAFLAHNRALVAEVAELEHKARRQDVLVDDDDDRGVLRGAHSRRASIRSRRSSAGARDAERAIRALLFLTRDDLMRHAAAHVTEELFPGDARRWRAPTLPLKYRFAPGPSARRPHAHRAAARCLTSSTTRACRGSCPGMIREKVTLLPEGAAEGVAQPADPAARRRSPRSSRPCRTAGEALPDALRGWLRTRLGRGAAGRRLGRDAAMPAASRDATCASSMPPARELAAGRDLAALRAQLGEAAQLSFAAAGPAFERQGTASAGTSATCRRRCRS